MVAAGGKKKATKPPSLRWDTASLCRPHLHPTLLHSVERQRHTGGGEQAVADGRNFASAGTMPGGWKGHEGASCFGGERFNRLPSLPTLPPPHPLSLPAYHPLLRLFVHWRTMLRHGWKLSRPLSLRFSFCSRHLCFLPFLRPVPPPSHERTQVRFRAALAALQGCKAYGFLFGAPLSRRGFRPDQLL